MNFFKIGLIFYLRLPGKIVSTFWRCWLFLSIYTFFILRHFFRSFFRLLCRTRSTNNCVTYRIYFSLSITNIDEDQHSKNSTNIRRNLAVLALSFVGFLLLSRLSTHSTTNSMVLVFFLLVYASGRFSYLQIRVVRPCLNFFPFFYEPKSWQLYTYSYVVFRRVAEDLSENSSTPDVTPKGGGNFSPYRISAKDNMPEGETVVLLYSI